LKRSLTPRSLHHDARIRHPANSRGHALDLIQRMRACAQLYPSLRRTLTRDFQRAAASRDEIVDRIALAEMEEALDDQRRGVALAARLVGQRTRKCNSGIDLISFGHRKAKDNPRLRNGCAKASRACTALAVAAAGFEPIESPEFPKPCASVVSGRRTVNIEARTSAVRDRLITAG
jgi:hypothetical protein